MSGRKDHWYNKAKQEGYRSRAAYKLKQLDEAASLIGAGDVVVDLGAAPGGWLQVAAELAGADGEVLGVDLQRIQPLEGVESLRGDLTDPDTHEAIRDRVGEADVVLSDMAPNMSGEYELDHARSVHLARQAFEVAQAVLAGGGDLVVKVFQGPDLEGLRADLEREFVSVRVVSPEASRPASSEVYLVAKRRLTAPVRAGDEVEVTVEAVGDEGDGIAKVDGFTLFVPGTEAGDELTVRVTDVKPRFGFAERLDE
ncbi:MAG: 23S rRNA (uridine(2552)-2'-O)-methyltransferase [Halobacteriales archaeon]|nr:23S rRNA (uridine(2552)-2'-O)-methyltransferase [Halobacteriales archaeon]